MPFTIVERNLVQKLFLYIFIEVEMSWIFFHTFFWRDEFLLTWSPTWLEQLYLIQIKLIPIRYSNSLERMMMYSFLIYLGVVLSPTSKRSLTSGDIKLRRFVYKVKKNINASVTENPRGKNALCFFPLHNDLQKFRIKILFSYKQRLSYQ